MQRFFLFLFLTFFAQGNYSPLEQQFYSNDVIKVNLESENCLVSVYDEDFIYVGCKNRVAIVNAISGELSHPVLYTPICDSIELDCPVNQVLALSPLRKNILTCFTEKGRIFVCTRFRKVNSVSTFVIKPFDETFNFRSHFLNPVAATPYHFDSRKNLFIAGYLGTPFPEIMKLNLDDDSTYTAALKINRGLHNKPQEILAGKPEFLAFIEVDEFMYVFLNEEYLENTVDISDLKVKDRSKNPDDGLQRARVVRLCVNDQPSEYNFKLWSYFVKAPISCLKNDTLFTRMTSVVYDNDADLIFATFSAHSPFIKGSAICTYEVTSLNKKFSSDLYEWISTDQLSQVENFDPNFQCKQEKNEFPQNFKLTVQSAIEAQSYFAITDYTAENIAVKTYVETETGALKSVILTVSKEGYLLRHHFIESSIVCPLTPFKLNLDLNEPVVGLHLVDSPDPEGLPKLAIVQRSKLILSPIQDCAILSSKRSCEAAEDPFCFWEPSNDGGKCKPKTGFTTGKRTNQCPYQLIPADYSEWSEVYLCANGCQCRHKHCMAATFDLLNMTHCPQGPFLMDVSKCPIAGNWSSWSPWSECVNNQRTKERRCDSPEPQYGGQDCMGAKIIYEKCDREKNPVVPPVLNSQVSDWSTWMIRHVDVEKNRWTETRFRAQFQPLHSFPTNGREDAASSLTFESMDRNCSLIVSQTCPTSPVMTDLLSMWTEWSPCSSACGEGRRIRSRRRCSGMVCKEEETITEVCKERDCPQPQASRTDLLCWSEWTQCSSKCGNGIRTRQRICPSDNYFNCLDGKQSVTEDCRGVACGDDHGLDLLTQCSLQAVEEYGCSGSSCPINSKNILRPCQLPPEAMLMSQNIPQEKNSNSPILYIVVIVATIVLTTIIIILIIFISRRCQGQRPDDGMSDERPYQGYPLIDMANGISRGSQMPYDVGFGVTPEPLNMSSSNMIPQLWNTRQPLGTFHDSDQPISNGYNTVDFSYSRQRRQELQEMERGSIRFYGTVDNRRGHRARAATPNGFI